jgi:hypothetical protein
MTDVRPSPAGRPHRTEAARVSLDSAIVAILRIPNLPETRTPSRQHDVWLTSSTWTRACTLELLFDASPTEIMYAQVIKDWFRAQTGSDTLSVWLHKLSQQEMVTPDDIPRLLKGLVRYNEISPRHPGPTRPARPRANSRRTPARIRQLVDRYALIGYWSGFSVGTICGLAVEFRLVLNDGLGPIGDLWPVLMIAGLAAACAVGILVGWVFVLICLVFGLFGRGER